MNSREDIKNILKKEAIKIINEQRFKGVEDLIYDILDYQKRGNEKRAEEAYGILFPRLAAAGFDREKLMKMKSELRTLDSEKDVVRFMVRWKIDNDKIDSNITHVYKIILTIPFTTTKNKDEKVKQLKYDLAYNGIKNLGYKELPISLIAVAGNLGQSINFKVLMKIKTKHKKSNLENILQPKYKVEKIKEFKDG